MKKVFLLFVLVTAYHFSISQQNKIPVDSSTGKVYFKEVVIVDSLTSEQIYIQSKEWFINTFRSAEAVIQMDDKANGRIIGKGFSDVTLPPLMGISVTTRLYYTIDVSIKDGKYKIEFYDIFYKNYPVKENNYTTTITYPSDWYLPIDKMYKKDGSEKKMNKGYYDQTLATINSLIISFKSHIKTSVKKNNDW